MIPYESLRSVIDNIEKILDGIFITGLGAVPQNIIDEMNRVAGKCDNHSLTLAGQLLRQMAEELDRRRHRLEFDYGGLVRSYCVLNSYLNLVWERIEVQVVKEDIEGIRS